MSFAARYARCYDSFSGASYDAYAAFFTEAAKRFSALPVREVLDLGCGTGELSARLAASGLDVVGADISPEMLARARSKEKTRGVLFVNQDMRALDLYGTVQAAVSAYDCLNYLAGVADLDRVFSLLHNYIEPGGVFVFDINTPYRYENVYADNCFCFEDETAMLVWRNRFSRSSGRNLMMLTLFERHPDGCWDRFDGDSVQRRFALRTVTKAAQRAGFDVCGRFGSLDFGPLSETSEKAFYVLRRMP